MSALSSPAWQSFFDEARKAPILDVARRLQITSKKAGLDYVSSCPRGCARLDGMVLTPSKNLFLCRPSGESGGVVELVMHAQECSVVEAAEFILNRDRPDRTADETPEEKQARERRRAKQERDAATRTRQEAKAAEFRRRKDEEAVDAILARAVPLVGTYGEDYLHARGIVAPKRLLGDLRFVQDASYFGFENADAKQVIHLATVPAMVALIRDVAGELIGLHLTYLDPDEPRKWRPLGDVNRNGVKKFRKYGVETLKGGMIRLGILGDSVAIAEGIETALSAHQLGICAGYSLGCAMSMGNLSGSSLGSNPHPTIKGPNGKPVTYPNGKPDMSKPGVILPAGVERVLILGDSDSDPLT